MNTNRRVNKYLFILHDCMPFDQFPFAQSLLVFDFFFCGGYQSIIKTVSESKTVDTVMSIVYLWLFVSMIEIQ